MRVTVTRLLVVVVPVALSCQYQVSPEGAGPMVSTVASQLLVTVGAAGVAGMLFTR